VRNAANLRTTGRGAAAENKDSIMSGFDGFAPISNNSTVN